MIVTSSHPVTVSEGLPGQPEGLKELRHLRMLVGGYVGLSLLTLAAIALLRNDGDVVNDAVWQRGSIVAVSALLMFAFATRAAHGSRSAYRRVRIVSAVMVAAIVAIIASPGTLPLWMKIEQGACGLVLVAVAVVANSGPLRSRFAAR